MSWTSPWTVASRIRVALPPSVRSMNGSSKVTDPFMTSADWSTNGSRISPLPNSSPTWRMAGTSIWLMMSMGLNRSRRMASRSSRPSLSPFSTLWKSCCSGGLVDSCSSSSAVFDAVLKWSMNRINGSFSPATCRLCRRSRQTCRSSVEIRARGSTRAASTMAASSPAATASCRNTELRMRRAAGARPKEMLLTPSTLRHPGNSALIRRMPSRVCRAASRRVLSPEPTVKVRQSKSRSSGRRPHSSTAMVWMARATRSLSSALMAMPRSSMVRATTAAPYFFAARQTRRMFTPPSSRLMELTIARPG